MFPQWLTDVASVASIVSLFVSLYVAWRIRAISYHYRQVALVPKAILTIRKHLKVLDTHIRSKNWHEIKKEAASITASVDQAKALTTGSTKQAADRTYEAARTVLEVNPSPLIILVRSGCTWHSRNSIVTWFVMWRARNGSERYQ